MIDGADIAFAEQLERAIRKALLGDDKTSGLYVTIRNSPNWEAFLRVRGVIDGYEAVIGEMQRIKRRMNGEPEERPQVLDRMMN